MDTDYRCWGFSELVVELESRDAVLMGWEHEIAKTLAGQGEEPQDLLRALLAEMRERYLPPSG